MAEARVSCLLHMAEQGSKLSLYLPTIPITKGWAVESEMSPIRHVGMLPGCVIKSVGDNHRRFASDML